MNSDNFQVRINSQDVYSLPIWSTTKQTIPSYPPNVWHCNVNVCDSYKDARATAPPANSAKLFEYAINELYDCDHNGSQTRLHSLEDSILGDENLYGSELKICGLSKDAENNNINEAIQEYIAKSPNPPPYISAVIPDSYIYALNDAAIHPADFAPQIAEIETSGSYIDPGSRAESDTLWPSIDTPIEIDLNNFGFKNIIFKAVFLSDKTCRIQISQGNIELFNDIVNRKGFTAAQTDYFKGNNIKNSFLNTSDNSPDAKLEATKYVLCKELGDTLQVIIGYIMMQVQNDLYTNKTLAAFTGDIPFACRSIVLGVPVLLRKLINNEKGSLLRHYSFYMPVSMSEEDRLIQIFNCKKKEVIAHNTGVKMRLNIFLREGIPLIQLSTMHEPTREKIRKDVIVPFFQQIAGNIDGANEYISDLQYDPAVELIEQIEKYRAYEIVSKKPKAHDYYLNMLLSRLFSGDDIGVDGDIIKQTVDATGTKTIGQYLKNIKPESSRRIRQPGGGKKKRGGKKKQSGGSMPSPEELYNFFNSDQGKYILPLALFELFYNYFKYVGETYYGDEFLKYFINEFLSDKLPSLQGFKNVYEQAKNRYSITEQASILQNDYEEAMIDDSIRLIPESVENITDTLIIKLTELCSELYYSTPETLVYLYSILIFENEEEESLESPDDNTFSSSESFDEGAVPEMDWQQPRKVQQNSFYGQQQQQEVPQNSFYGQQQQPEVTSRSYYDEDSDEVPSWPGGSKKKTLKKMNKKKIRKNKKTRHPKKNRKNKKTRHPKKIRKNKKTRKIRHY
jgi:hypothetical protein